ncbi:unnamed protein product [Symbiodinium natans]|uniref:Uncharacterized protein n=1 Tax=Symbiodinium natans TaxID=878477 RepID=A0A812RH31_9DINO|nr:unnamed protein product [Symbiodinium natans]
MGGVSSAISGGKKLANLIFSRGKSKVDRDKFDRAFSKYPPTPSRTWGFQNSNAALYANDSWFSAQKRIRLSDINRFLGIRPYPGKPAGKAFLPGDYNLVWGNPERHSWSTAEDQNYSLQFSRQQHHDVGTAGALCVATLPGHAPSRGRRRELSDFL